MCVLHAKLLQLCLTLCNPMDCSPWGSSVPGYSPGKNTVVGCHALLQGIFLILGLSPHLLCLLHRQVGSLPLVPPGKPTITYNIRQKSWVFIGRTDVEAETPILWPPDMKSWFIWKDPDAGKDWGQEQKGTREDETVGWHHWLNGHEFGEAWCAAVHGVAGSQTQLSNWTELNWTWSHSKTPTGPLKKAQTFFSHLSASCNPE